MPKGRRFDPNDITSKCLIKLQDASLLNAHSLIEDAELLLAAGRLARAYYLASTSIEEVGKAILCYLGLKRKLNRSEVKSRIASDLGSHGRKLSMALNAVLITPHGKKFSREEIMNRVNLAISLEYGRESALYSNYKDGIVKIPDNLVSKKKCERRPCSSESR